MTNSRIGDARLADSRLAVARCCIVGFPRTRVYKIILGPNLSFVIGHFSFAIVVVIGSLLRWPSYAARRVTVILFQVKARRLILLALYCADQRPPNLARPSPVNSDERSGHVITRKPSLWEREWWG